MPKLIWDEKYWLDRADEAGAIGSEFRSPECKTIMGEIEECYRQLARLTREFQVAAKGGGVGQHPAAKGGAAGR